MIRINLLPIRQTRKIEAVRRELVLAGLLGFVILVGCFAVWGIARAQLARVESRNRALDAEIAKLAEDVARVDEMEKFKAELERKLSVIAELRDAKTGPVHMLDDLATAAPDKLQVTSVGEEKGAVEMTGIAVSNEVISQFLRSLEASDYFDQVYLQDIEALPPEKDLSVTLKQFSLTARLVTPRQRAKAEEAAAEAVPTDTKGAPGGGT